MTCGLWPCGVHATPTPSPFPWKLQASKPPTACHSKKRSFAAPLLHFSSLTRGGNSFPASGVYGPHQDPSASAAQDTSCCECRRSSTGPNPPSSPELYYRQVSSVFSCAGSRLVTNQTSPLPLCGLCRAWQSVTRRCHILAPAEAPGDA